MRIDQYNYIKLTKLDLSDNIGSVASSPEIYNMFIVEPGPTRLYDFPYPDTTQLAITYELSRDLNIIRRKVYGVLDYLGDLGGLAGALRGLFTVIVLIFQYKVVLNYVSNHTFLIRDGDERSNVPGAIEHSADGEERVTLKRIPVGFFGGVWLSLQRIFSCFTRCHTNRDKFSHAADRMVKEELKIVGWVQHMRCQKLAMKKLFTEQQWKEIELEAKFRTLAIDPKTGKVMCISDAQQESKVQPSDDKEYKDSSMIVDYNTNSSAMGIMANSPDKTDREVPRKKIFENAVQANHSFVNTNQTIV